MSELLLACKAIYMIHMNLAEHQKLVLRACTYWDCALPVFCAAIEHPTEENCDAMMAFSYLLVAYTLTIDVDDTLLLVGNGSDPQENPITPF